MRHPAPPHARDAQVQISGVPESNNISYQLAVGQTVDAGRWFLTPPKVAPDSHITIAVVGDWGQTDNSVKTGQHMLDANASITLIAGDLSYADGFQPYWDSWGRMVESLLSSRPFMAAPGTISHFYFLPFAHIISQLANREGILPFKLTLLQQVTTKSKRISWKILAALSHSRRDFVFPRLPAEPTPVLATCIIHSTWGRLT